MNITTHILEDPREPREYKPRPRPSTITERRKEVLYWMARGKTNQEIAAILRMNVLTLKNTIEKILEIYGAQNRVCAVMTAAARGDIAIDEAVREFA